MSRFTGTEATEAPLNKLTGIPHVLPRGLTGGVETRAETKLREVSQVGDEAPRNEKQAEDFRRAHVEPDQLEVRFAMRLIAPRRGLRQIASIGGVGQRRLRYAPTASGPAVHVKGFSSTPRRLCPKASGRRIGGDESRGRLQEPPARCAHHLVRRQIINKGRGRSRISPPVRPLGRPRLCGTTSEAVPAAPSALYFGLLQVDQPTRPTGTVNPPRTATRLLFSPPAELRPFLQDRSYQEWPRAVNPPRNEGRVRTHPTASVAAVSATRSHHSSSGFSLVGDSAKNRTIRIAHQVNQA